MQTKELALGCDHAGFKLKEALINYLKEKKIEFEDYGTFSEESVDYPDFAHSVADAVNSGVSERGILICGSGNGVNMTANKYPNVRAALCWNTEIARLARMHNNANIISFPGRFIDKEEALKALDAFLNTDFDGGRHAIRVQKIPCK
ncbi:MAG: ribose 5-phosphate isomerase B [Bacteroidales bacterium]|nr:ribose 5-phosphate isomerase B [Bacteroidales bacterium]